MISGHLKILFPHITRPVKGEMPKQINCLPCAGATARLSPAKKRKGKGKGGEKGQKTSPADVIAGTAGREKNRWARMGRKKEKKKKRTAPWRVEANIL